ncbi:MAG: translation initiation factor Sui1 [Candidatus Latescibacterota bacterium]
MAVRPPDKNRVYSTVSGRICPDCGQPAASCMCARKPNKPQGDGIVRVRREVKGRGGKTVSTISGILLEENELRELASQLKHRFGTGGSVKDGIVEIQGNHVDSLIAELIKMGFTVKKSGG